MDSKLYLQRAENEIKLAEIIFRLSKNTEIQIKTFDIKDPETYYSAVISHCYYAIFYAAKSYLASKKVKIRAPEEHRKAFEAFRNYVESGELDVELLKIYQEAIVRADSLLGIFQEEKNKRGRFTYRTVAQANREPAKESLERSRIFFKHIFAIVS